LIAGFSEKTHGLILVPLAITKRILNLVEMRRTRSVISVPFQKFGVYARKAKLGEMVILTALAVRLYR